MLHPEHFFTSVNNVKIHHNDTFAAALTPESRRWTADLQGLFLNIQWLWQQFLGGRSTAAVHSSRHSFCNFGNKGNICISLQSTMYTSYGTVTLHETS